MTQKTQGLLTPSTSPPVDPPTLYHNTTRMDPTAAASFNAIHSQPIANSRPKVAAATQRKRPSSAVEQEGRKDDKRIKMADLRDSLRDSNFAQPSGLNPDLIGAKVTRWWAQSQSWFNGVITDYKASKNQYCVSLA